MQDDNPTTQTTGWSWQLIPTEPHNARTPDETDETIEIDWIGMQDSEKPERSETTERGDPAKSGGNRAQGIPDKSPRSPDQTTDPATAGSEEDGRILAEPSSSLTTLSDDELARGDPDLWEHGWSWLHPQPCPECEDVYERLNSDDPIVRAMLAERERCELLVLRSRDRAARGTWAWRELDDLASKIRSAAR